MAKRKLTRNQTRRIRLRQQASHNQPAIDEQSLGEEQDGRVVAHYGTQVDIEYAQGERIRCFMRANLESIVTGDHVRWSHGDDIGVVVACRPRSSLLSRPDSYGKLKPVAANVDQIIVTVAPEPEYHQNLIDRYLVVAQANDIEAILLINKEDLIADSKQEEFDKLISDYQTLGYKVHRCSAKNKDSLKFFEELLKDKTSVFVGQSGVGKSSIIKQLAPENEIEIGQLSDAKTKGRHTTTHSELFHFSEGGECIDSPGIREFGLWHLSEEEVTQGFPEIQAHAEHCKFRDCKHINEPHCAVKSALENGDICQRRFDSYQRILNSLDDVTIQPSS